MQFRAALKRYKSPIIDSSRWDNFVPRADDVVVATPQKGGTTWTQGILAHLVFPDGLTRPVSSISHWLDARVMPLEPMLTDLETQTHKRFIKTHLPADGVPLHPEVRYIVVGRDGRDLAMSLWHHYRSFADETLIKMRERAMTSPHDGVASPRAPDDINTFWHNWTTRGAFDWQQDGWPFWSDLHVMQSWWEQRNESNVLLLHYADMLADPAFAIAQIADFTNVKIALKRRTQVVEAVSFEAMKKNGETYVPFGGQAWTGGADTFFHKGTNGRWKEEITAANLAAYERAAQRVLSPACRAWVTQGRAAWMTSAGA